MPSEKCDTTVQQVKKLISSVLISNPSRYIPVAEFENDYRDLIGSPIPYAKLGFSSLKTFFLSIPDVLEMKSKNGVVVIVPVVNKKVAHIKDMISKQKKSTSRKKQALAFIPPSVRNRKTVKQPHGQRRYHLSLQSDSGPACDLKSVASKKDPSDVNKLGDRSETKEQDSTRVMKKPEEARPDLTKCNSCSVKERLTAAVVDKTYVEKKSEDQPGCSRDVKNRSASYKNQPHDKQRDHISSQLGNRPTHDLKSGAPKKDPSDVNKLGNQGEVKERDSTRVIRKSKEARPDLTKCNPCSVKERLTAAVVDKKLVEKKSEDTPGCSRDTKKCSASYKNQPHDKQRHHISSQSGNRPTHDLKSGTSKRDPSDPFSLDLTSVKSGCDVNKLDNQGETKNRDSTRVMRKLKEVRPDLTKCNPCSVKERLTAAVVDKKLVEKKSEDTPGCSSDTKKCSASYKNQPHDKQKHHISSQSGNRPTHDLKSGTSKRDPSDVNKLDNQGETKNRDSTRVMRKPKEVRPDLTKCNPCSVKERLTAAVVDKKLVEKKSEDTPGCSRDTKKCSASYKNQPHDKQRHHISSQSGNRPTHDLKSGTSKKHPSDVNKLDNQGETKDRDSTSVMRKPKEARPDLTKCNPCSVNDRLTAAVVDKKLIEKKSEDKQGCNRPTHDLKSGASKKHPSDVNKLDNQGETKDRDSTSVMRKPKEARPDLTKCNPCSVKECLTVGVVDKKPVDRKLENKPSCSREGQNISTSKVATKYPPTYIKAQNRTKLPASEQKNYNQEIAKPSKLMAEGIVIKTEPTSDDSSERVKEIPANAVIQKGTKGPVSEKTNYSREIVKPSKIRTEDIAIKTEPIRSVRTKIKVDNTTLKILQGFKKRIETNKQYMARKGSSTEKEKAKSKERGRSTKKKSESGSSSSDSSRSSSESSSSSGSKSSSSSSSGSSSRSSSSSSDSSSSRNRNRTRTKQRSQSKPRSTRKSIDKDKKDKVKEKENDINRDKEKDAKSKTASISDKKSDAKHRSRSRSRSSHRKKRHRSPTPRPTKIHIGRLTRTVNREHIYEIFGAYGVIKNVEFPKDHVHSHIGRGYAYVEYSNADEAEDAMKHMDGGQIDGQEITAAPVLIPKPRPYMPRRSPMPMRRLPMRRPPPHFRRRSPLRPPRRSPPRRRPRSRNSPAKRRKRSRSSSSSSR